LEAQGDARQGMVSVEYHVLGVDFADGVQHIARASALQPAGRAWPSMVMPSSRLSGNSERGSRNSS
jgi:hypothetical protein